MKLSALASGKGGRAGAPGILLVPERALQLNQTAFELLERCDASWTLAEITSHLASEHNLPSARVELDVASFVGELERRRILVFES